jgi:PAS domain S-box-containing protein
MSSRLPYKFLLMLLIFAVILIVPYSLITYSNSSKMIEGIDKVEPLNSEQRAIHNRYIEDLTENLIALSFYIFIIAFILSLFFSRKFLVPVKQLHGAAQSIKEGKLDIKLDIFTGDEFAEVSKAFNEMALALRQKNTELMRKDLYVSMMKDPIWVADDDNFIVDINPAFTELFGYDRDEVVGSSLFDFLDEESDKIMRTQLRERGKGESATYEVSIISKKKGLIPVLISGAPLVEGDEVVGKIGIIKDFRAEKALREALRDEMDFTEAIMQSMSDALLVIDKDYKVVKANMAAVAHAGRDIVGQHCYEVLHSRTERCYIHGEVCPSMTVFETGKSFKTVHTHVMGGTKVFHDITAYPIKDRHGDIKYSVEVLRDVTDSKKLDDEIAQKNRELTLLNSISKILSQSLKAEDIFENIFHKVTAFTGMDGGGIYLIDNMGKTLESKYSRGLSEDFMRTAGMVRMGEDLPGRVALTGQTIIINDISQAEAAGGSMLKHSGIRGYTCAPIRGKEKMLGVFYMFSLEPHAFTLEEERILDSISEMMGIALENIRLYEKMRYLYEHQRLRREEEQKNLLGLTSMLSATLDIKSVLEGSLSLVKESGRADFVWLLEADDSGNMRVKAASEEGVSDSAVVYGNDLKTIESLAIESREPVMHSSLDNKAKYYFAEGVKIYNTACSIPLYVGDKVLGALSLYYKTLKEIKDEYIHFLSTIGSILAVAMERARLYDDVIMERGMAATILEGIADGVMTVDMFGTVISMNRAAEEIIGILPRSGVGLNWRDVFDYSEENEELQIKMKSSLKEATKGVLASREADLVTMNGSRIPLMFKSASVRDNHGEIIGVTYVLRDLSREKQLDMLKTEFVKAVSHEFRTPLASMVGMAEMVLDEDVRGNKAKEYLHGILSEGARLSALVSDVLDVARIESGKEIFTETEIDFAALVKNVEESFETVIKNKKIKFSTDVSKIKGYRGDEEKLKHMLRNIVDNSLTYSDSGKHVTLSVHKDREKVKIMVRDEGWGIPEEDLGHVGEKFYRGVYSVRTTGTGLGLAISRDIVKMHGGKFHIDSKLGKGATVTVELPFRRKV